jgi:hypothetical protein
MFVDSKPSRIYIIFKYFSSNGEMYESHLENGGSIVLRNVGILPQHSLYGARKPQHETLIVNHFILCVSNIRH